MSLFRELQDGTLEENGIINGSKIIVTPNVETGLVSADFASLRRVRFDSLKRNIFQAQRTENTVMQALESLNDNQVNDFLSGKSPLNLSVRLGDHMMLIQLQLSTLSPSQQNVLKQKVANAALLKQQAANRSIINCDNPQPSTSGCHKRANADDFDDDLTPEKQRKRAEKEEVEDDSRSPIKSLSSMVSSPLTTTVQNMNQNNSRFWSPSVDPIAANLTSCLCKSLNISCNNNCGQHPRGESSSCCTHSSTHDAQNVIKPPPRIIPFHHRPSASVISQPKPSSPTPSTSSAQPSLLKHLPLESGTDQLFHNENPALAEASRNLTQTLRKLSKRVFTSKSHMLESGQSSSSGASSSRCSSISKTQSPSLSGASGAVIESMKHHGKGIYSGTFSGTLNPALQDKNGRPKRDISTIIHILNDLLSATPQCARNGAKIFFEPTQTSNGASGKVIKVSWAVKF